MTSNTHTSEERPARVIIVDDHELARAGVRSLLAHLPDIEVIGEGGSGKEAIALCRELKPDLALLDIRMPELDGLAATREIKRELPATRVLILTTHDHPDYLIAALKAGAAGYLLKDISRDELVSTMRRVLQGESILSGEMAARALKRIAAEPTPRDGAVADRLTPREGQVLQLIVDGLTNREIASRLMVSSGTVKIHVEHIIAKLGVSDRTQAAVHAVRSGLVQLADIAP